MTSPNLREMLELAAQAAGYTVRWHEHWKCFVHDKLHYVNSVERFVWMPESDDGDSARLRSSRMIDVEWTGIGVVVIDYDSRARFREPFADHNNDRNAALRMATLRCAVEYARRMK